MSNADKKQASPPIREQPVVSRPFIVFSGFKYYAAAGWQNYVGDAETLEEAVEIGKQNCQENYDWWQVVDLTKKEIVAGEGSSHTGLFGEFPANPGG